MANCSLSAESVSIRIDSSETLASPVIAGIVGQQFVYVYAVLFEPSGEKPVQSWASYSIQRDSVVIESINGDT